MGKITFGDDKKTVTAQWKLLVALSLGIVAGMFAWLFSNWQIGLLGGWDVAALTYLIWTWASVGGMDGVTTEAHALREDPSRPTADAVILFAVVGSLAAVAIMLAHSSDTQGAAMVLGLCFSILSIVVSWITLHTLFMLHYAEQYYLTPIGGVDFGDTKKPTYRDFAYLAFTIGMTFQVSDTQLSAKNLRRVALKHALFSYVFGTVIVAATVNLIAGLGK